MVLAALPFCWAFGAGSQPVTGFNTDTNSTELRELATPLEVDESRYGCGPLLEPGDTYYVSLAGDDLADGLAWERAWRTIQRGVKELKPGDTLLIGEGEYTEPQIEINVRTAQEGTPGRPIRIMAAPRQRVMVSGAPLFAGFQKAAGAPFTYVADFAYPEFRTVWEEDTTIELQSAGGRDQVDELPGTFWHDAAAGKLYVRFSDSRGPEVHRGVRVMLVTEAAKAAHVSGAYLEGLAELYLPRDVRNAIRIHGSYIHLKGLWFKHQTDSVAIGANVDWRTGQPLPNAEAAVRRAAQHRRRLRLLLQREHGRLRQRGHPVESHSEQLLHPRRAELRHPDPTLRRHAPDRQPDTVCRVDAADPRFPASAARSTTMRAASVRRASTSSTTSCSIPAAP